MKHIFRNWKCLKIAFMSVLLILITLAGALTSQAAFSAENLRGELWKEGGVNTADHDSTLTGNALLKYAKEGVFGQDCQAYVSEYKTATLEQMSSSACIDARKFYDNAAKYAKIVDAKMHIADTDGQKLNAAMIRFSDLSTNIFSILIGFGLLTAFLVFTVLFMRVAWMPSHVMEKRRVIIDIATSGISVVLLGNAWMIISLFQATFQRFWQTYAVYSKDWRTVMEMVMVEYKSFIVGLSGIATIFVLAMLLINFISLSVNGANNQKRTEKIGNIINCGIAAVGLSSITIIVSFFWELFSR